MADGDEFEYYDGKGGPGPGDTQNGRGGGGAGGPAFCIRIGEHVDYDLIEALERLAALDGWHASMKSGSYVELTGPDGRTVSGNASTDAAALNMAIDAAQG